MPHCKYLIIGSSHAALEAVSAIRMQDTEGSLTMITRDSHLPYSPTVLPYVVSGRSKADNVALRDQSYFEQHAVEFVTNRSLSSIEPDCNTAVLDNGDRWQYEKLLLATGASPIIPPIPGLDKVKHLVLRTLEDAVALRDASQKAKKAIVLGAGLVGMHGAENLAEAGLEVTIIEMQTQVLPGYFDPQAAQMIQSAFDQHGINMKMGHKAVSISPQSSDQQNTGCRVELDSGETLDADLLLVSTGVRPIFDYCSGSHLQTDQGILVDNHMSTNQKNIWAAGDVAQAKDFYSDTKVTTGILPDAVEQGRIAGMAMSDDPSLKNYSGGVPINTYTFYGQQAISVGTSDSSSGPLNGEPTDKLEIELTVDSDKGYFQKIIFKDNRLQGISGINAALDPGIMWQLILRRIDLGAVKKEFVAQPLETGRRLMSGTWR
ncbi:NADH-dependent phenylglyoxylate dehydrogenase subunit epsilon [Motiliproteus sp. MSK22-1]|uniref:NADH-dependent phenylglyoxylate dehydrogenase subunit epsilon n=1 Tax=Motiliproteus sp. MSK22-1 TaxID=1897630 RepID=UPI000978A2E9|nr:FAD/NAD(P)-binding oxidoreductase [Motiliproteus sp. MSK22-1]OMH29182.1 phenylglyoxylate dehydrogenase [Motiliproteus sp. MSK22-1]